MNRQWATWAKVRSVGSIAALTLARSQLVLGGALAGVALVIGASVALWAPFTGTAEVQASCARPRASVIPDQWRQQHAQEGTAFHDAVLSGKARQAILQPARVSPAPAFASVSPGRQIEALRTGTMIVRPAAPEQELGAIDWGIASEGPYYATQLHGFAGIGRVLASSDQLPEEIERKIAAFIKDWAVCNMPEPGLSDRAWYEGTVVKRLSNLLVGLNYMKRHGSLAGLSYEELVYLIVANKDFLIARDGIYVLGNHGIRQDMALAATAIALPELPDSGFLIRLAENRLQAAARDLFTDEGIWIEHAPGYVNYAVRLMAEIEDLAKADPRFDPDEFLGRLPTSIEYLLNVLTPDLQIPWVGETDTTVPIPEIEQYAQRIYGKDLRQYVDGLSGTARLYRGYGQGIVRGEDGFYFLFHAAQNLPAGKRHEDALSFLLFNRGRLWLTEGGHESYEPSPMTRYLASPWAHNSYVYGDQYIHTEARPDLRAFIRGMTVQGDEVAIAAVSERFAQDASVSRRVTLDRASHDIVIRDVLSAPRPNGACFHGSLHFAPDLQLEMRPQAGTIVAADPGSGTTLTVGLAAAHLAGLHRFSGQDDPPRGWGRVVDGFGPVQTVVYDVCGSGPVEIDLTWSAGGRE